ncbi:MAG: PilZ domain-containing protein [Methylococcales bacterium]|nr:PilZ domain-containing protein [Methylococcales bacterium]
MQTHDEKRDYMRMHIDCEMTYRLADSQLLKTGHCQTISAAGLSFIADEAFDTGLAMEVRILSKAALIPPMTAFVEVVRNTRQADGNFEIAAVIRSIKGN